MGRSLAIQLRERLHSQEQAWKATWETLAGIEAFQAPLILLLAPTLLILWVYYGKSAHFVHFFGGSGGLRGRGGQDVYAVIYEYLAAFLVLFCIPALLVKAGFKRPLREFGLQHGDAREGLRLTAAALPVLLVAVYLGSADPAMQAEYPQAKSTIGHLAPFLIVEGFYLLYYLGWEFFFRGFMLFGLEQHYGALAAVLIQTIPSAIAHIGKPFPECFAAIFAGIVFGYVAVRSRSVFYPLLLHAAVGIGTDVFVMMRLV
jgi:membrane protease YdiL (CAAX protease family)